MKKVALSLATVLAAATFAQEASAVPAFARQTGMACNACHTQHFPILSGFGRAFKADGFTMMGSQEKIEGEHLSIPAVLNTGILLKAQYRKTNGAKKVYDKVNAANASVGVAQDLGTTTVTNNEGAWMVPDEFGLFFAGRLADTGTLKVGTMIEHNMDDLVGFRIPVVTDVGAVKLSVIPFLTDALSPFYGYTESSTGLNRAIRWNEHHADISAHRFVGMATGAASGLAFVAKTDMGYINYSRWTDNFPMAQQSLSSNLIHVGLTPNVAGFDMVLTAEFVSGKRKDADGATTFSFVDGYATKSSGFSAQATGDVAGFESSFYATYAVAPKSSASETNGYNTSLTDDKSAMTVGADVSVIPHMLHLAAAYRNGKASGKTDNSVTLAATYDLAQNMALQVTHSARSGTKYNTAQADGTQQTSILLETAW
ncbi:MAG: hypothetical protein C0406_03805 [Sideroxydans sp.]|nr:hypothetical protein [Sideroxydans sp.]